MCPSISLLKTDNKEIWVYNFETQDVFEPLGTVNREYFNIKIFSDSMACVKIKRTKYMRNINNNAVQGRLSENYLTRKIIA